MFDEPQLSRQVRMVERLGLHVRVVEQFPERYVLMIVGQDERLRGVVACEQDGAYAGRCLAPGPRVRTLWSDVLEQIA